MKLLSQVGQLRQLELFLIHQQPNSYWDKGPDMLNSLSDVLMRMRQEKIAVNGDISNHQVR